MFKTNKRNSSPKKSPKRNQKKNGVEVDLSPTSEEIRAKKLKSVKK